MRSRKLLSVLGFIILVGLTLSFVSCGSDKTPTGATGSITDPDFVAVQQDVNYFVDSTLEFFVNGFGNMYALADQADTLDPVFYGPVYPDSDFVSATYVNGWHVIYISRNRSTHSTAMRDSVRFFSNGVVQQTATNVDSLYYKHEWNYRFHDTTVSNTSYDGRVDFDITGLSGSLATINGSHIMSITHKFVSSDSTVWKTFDFSADLSSFTVSKTPVGWAQGCPAGGTINGTVKMTYKKDGASETYVTWKFTLSFNNGTMSATIKKGTTTWGYTSQVCLTSN
ncbi:MAG: hypothetical protein GXO93_04665 [FCB group bacterium]|nr:hypothetical protein [FCB group bacterium]